jgi:hypothetical protein
MPLKHLSLLGQSLSLLQDFPGNAATTIGVENKIMNKEHAAQNARTTRGNLN